ncbi:MAG: lipoprotein [Candidatus Latescibacteria bacterium]|nr:lipoprotein [Candidatus Latescibacterota bacterium]
MNKFLIFLLLTLLLSGCSGGITGFEGAVDYDELIKSGWIEYNRYNYDEALDLFTQAKDYDEFRPEGYIGSGWTQLRLQHPDSAIIEFRTSFEYVISLSDSVDTISGLAGSYLATGQNSNIVNMFVKYQVSSYEDAFPLEDHDFELDTGDLEIVQAMAFYRLGLYSSTEQSDPNNAVYHLNQVLYTPHEYSGPQLLIEAITGYMQQSDSSYY